MFISRMRLTVCTYCVVATAAQAVYIAVTFQCCLSANWPATPCVLCINLSSWHVDTASCSFITGSLCRDSTGVGNAFLAKIADTIWSVVRMVVGMEQRFFV